MLRYHSLLWLPVIHLWVSCIPFLVPVTCPLGCFPISSWSLRGDLQVTVIGSLRKCLAHPMSTVMLLVLPAVLPAGPPCCPPCWSTLPNYSPPPPPAVCDWYPTGILSGLGPRMVVLLSAQAKESRKWFHWQCQPDDPRPGPQECVLTSAVTRTEPAE